MRNRYGRLVVVALISALACGLASDRLEPASDRLEPASGRSGDVLAGSSIQSASYLDLTRGANELYRIRTDDGFRLIYIHCSARSCYKVYGSSAV